MNIAFDSSKATNVPWKVIHYSQNRYPFAELMRHHLGVGPLELLHLVWPLAPLTKSTEQKTALHQRMYAIGDEFKSVYRRFVVDVIQPFVGERVVLQCIPNFRFQMPNSAAVTSWHRDKDTGHGERELNIWVPLTAVCSRNCVWLESSPGLEDYLPAVVPEGCALVFDGANLRHGNVVNTSSFTRVSFDFRVIKESEYEDRAQTSVNLGKRFAVGEYFEHTDDASR
jgi:hypothetical protein